MPPGPFPGPPSDAETGEDAGAVGTGVETEEGVEAGAGAGAEPGAPKIVDTAHPRVILGLVASEIRTTIVYELGNAAGIWTSTTMEILVPAATGHLTKLHVGDWKG